MSDQKTKQEIVRLNHADRQKLEELKVEFGSKSQALRIAIRRLHEATFA